MSRLPVFTERDGQGFVPMQPAEPPSEDELQSLIAAHPELIAGRGEPLLLIKREQGVPDHLDGPNRFSLDNLFVTRSAVPVLVEVKRATNTELKRKVIGQLLDYAANGAAYWQPGTLEAEFRAQSERDGRDPDEIMREFLPGNKTAPEDAPDDATDPNADFWQKVDTNLAAGNMRLVVVADTVPTQLARVIEFLNEQMRAIVLAIELTYYRGESGLRTLVPKVIGETERANAAKISTPHGPHGVTLDDWMEEREQTYGEEFAKACRTLFGIVKDLGGVVKVGSNPKELFFDWARSGRGVLRPLYSTQGGRIGICFAYLKTKPEFVDAAARQALYDEVAAIVGGLSTSNLEGFPSFDVRKLLDAETAARFGDMLKSVVERALRTG